MRTNRIIHGGAVMLRDYQQRSVDDARRELATHDRVFLQNPTGSGKSVIYAAIIESAYSRDNTAWIVVPRLELVAQMSAHLTKWHVPHGMITASSKESRAYKVHVVSMQTVKRRIKDGKIKNFPRLLLIDEAHLSLDTQKEIIAALPETSKVIGCSATPERLDGKALSDVYQSIIYGPSIPYLTQAGFLAPVRYFAPPDININDLKFIRGEADATELEKLLTARKVYGRCIDYYRRFGINRPALIFCRTLKSAEQTAAQFREHGYNFEYIAGDMSHKKRQDLLDALDRGAIQGLAAADLPTYGVDIPRLSYIAFLRPTQSRALFFQMCGRGMRIAPGKQDCIIVDHVNCLQFHQSAGMPLIFSDHVSWAFYGRDKKQKEATPPASKLCPYNDYEYCWKPSCVGCPKKPESAEDPRKTVIVDIPLEEKKAPISLAAMLPEEKQEYQDRIGRATDEAQEGLQSGEIRPGPIGELLAIAKELNRKPMWVYWHLTEATRYTVNVPLIYEIARQCGYKPGWAWHKANEIKAQKMEAAG
ncbi:DEAD/DEAH box helicase [Treponema primitia]|uniref:DEAD/DEAH box helicase n=1 Tax=Treponema primitia TaxID=88058 RepID=UPI00397F8E47